MKIKDFALALTLSALPQLALADGPVAAWLYTPDLLGSAEASFENFDGAVICLARADSKSEAFMGTVPRYATGMADVRSSYDSHDAALSAFVKGDCDLAWVPANVATAFLDTDGNAGDYQAFWLPADGQ